MLGYIFSYFRGISVIQVVMLLSHARRNLFLLSGCTEQLAKAVSFLIFENLFDFFFMKKKRTRVSTYNEKTSIPFFQSPV